MNPVQVSTIFSLLLATCYCHEHMNSTMQTMYKECSVQNGFTKEIASKFRKEHHDFHFKPEDVPIEFICMKKCMDEKFGFLKDAKLNIDAIRKDVLRINRFRRPEEYLKCLEQIGRIKSCEDYKKKIQCDYDVGETHQWACAAKLKFDEQKKSEDQKGRKIKRRCVEKCIMESMGIIDKDGKIVIEKVDVDTLSMFRVKDKNKLFACLKDLVIKECDDVSKMWTCRDSN